MTKHTILFLAANPRGTGDGGLDPHAQRSALEEEASAIQRELKLSGYRHRFEIVTRWAVEPLDLLRALRELKPTVVHFSGHGGRDGLFFQAHDGEARVVSPAAIAEAFGAVGGGAVKVVVLSACYSEGAAEALLGQVECVVGMTGALPDGMAKAFAIGFYGALGEQASVAAAYRQGNAAIGLEGLVEADRPQLKVRAGGDAARLVLADDEPEAHRELACSSPGMRPYGADDAAHFHGRGVVSPEGMIVQPRPQPFETRNREWIDDLLEGIPDPSPMRAFLVAYLGTDDNPVAFGGRHHTMARLRGWLDDSDAPSHCFLVAPSGRGKSAVVAHLISECASRPDLAIVFVPVSNLFGTNRAGTVVPSLVARIATLHNERPPTHLDLMTSRRLFGDYLRRRLPGDRRLLLVLDGVDEAADWDLDAALLPTDLASGTKVLLSVRSEPGQSDEVLRRRLTLAPRRVVTERLDILDRAGVAEALRTVGQDRIAADPDGLKRVLDVCEGDPLLLKLLVEMLEASQTDWLSPDALPPDLQPGLAGIWDLQLRQRDREALAEEGATAAVLGVLGCALGPVGRDDILRIARGEVRNGLALDQVVARLGRFVHLVEAGYSFSHPRLREYVIDKVLAPEDRSRWEQRLVEDGRTIVRALADGLEPTEVSRFVLRFHAAHLRRSKAPVDAWLELVSDGWRRAWSTLDPHQAGFLGDVERAREVAAAANRAAVAAGSAPPFLDAVIRCALCAASVHSQTTNLRPELLHRLISSGVWSPAQALAHITATMDDPDEPLESRFDRKLKPIIPVLDRDTLKAALELVTTRTNRDAREQLDLWRSFIFPMIQMDVDELVNQARSLRHLHHRTEALFAIAAAGDDHPELRDVLRRDASMMLAELGRPFPFLDTVMQVVDLLDERARNDLLEQARVVTMSIDSADYRVMTLARLGQLCTGEAGARAVLDAVRLSCSSDKQRGLATVLDSLVPASQETIRTGLDLVLASGRLGELVDWVMHAVSARWSWLSQHLDESRRDLVVREALTMAREQWQRAKRADGLRALAEMSGGDRALQIIRDEADERHRRTGFAQLADLLPTDEQLALIQELLESGALEHVRWVLGEIVPVFDTARREDLIGIFDKLDLPAIKADILLSLGQRMQGEARASLAQSAREAALRVHDPVERIGLLERAYSAARSEPALAALVEDIARLPDGARSLRRQAIHHLTMVLAPTERSRVVHLLARGDELDGAAILIGNADEQLRSVGRVGISRLARPFLRMNAYLQFSELTTDTRERRAAVEDALATSREIDDAGEACSLAAAMQPGPAMLREIVDRLLRLPDEGQRFRALTGVLAHAGPLHDEVMAACVESAPALFLDELNSSLWFFMHHAEPARRDEVAAELFEEVRRHYELVRDVLGRWRTMPTDDLEDAGLLLGEPRSALIRSLQNLLFQIAAHLPVACAEEALAFIPWQWTGVVLQLRVPLGATEARRAEIIAELVRLARIRQGYTRGPLLACLVGYVSPEERAPMIVEALREAQVFVPYPGADPKDNRGAVLGNLARYLDESHIERIVELAPDAWRDHRAVGAFVATLRPELCAEVTQRLLHATSSTGQHEVLIAGLAAHVPDADLDRVVQAIAATCRGKRAVLEVLIPKGVAERFTGARLEKLFALAVEASRRGTSRPWDSTLDVVALLGRQRLRQSRAHATELLELIEHFLDTRANDRAQMLSTIRSFSPLLQELGGQEAMTATARAILDVTSWWP